MALSQEDKPFTSKYVNIVQHFQSQDISGKLYRRAMYTRRTLALEDLDDSEYYEAHVIWANQ